MRPSCLSQSLSSQSQNSPEMYHSSAEQIHFPQWQEPEITMGIISYCEKKLEVSIKKRISLKQWQQTYNNLSSKGKSLSNNCFHERRLYLLKYIKVIQESLHYRSRQLQLAWSKCSLVQSGWNVNGTGYCSSLEILSPKGILFRPFVIELHFKVPVI